MAVAYTAGTDKMLRISKELSYLLRHKPPTGKVVMRQVLCCDYLFIYGLTKVTRQACQRMATLVYLTSSRG